MMGTSTTSQTVSVIATGAFNAGGTANFGSKTVTLDLNGGTIQFTTTTKSDKQNTNSGCLFAEVNSSTYTLGHGTGAFKGVTGTGVAGFTLHALTPRLSNGKCNDNATPVAEQLVATLKGPVSLSSRISRGRQRWRPMKFVLSIRVRRVCRTFS